MFWIDNHNQNHQNGCFWSSDRPVNDFRCEKVNPINIWTKISLAAVPREQQEPNPAIITWLASTKAPKHVLTKSLKLNFRNLWWPIYNSKFTRQIFYDKWNWHASLISKDICNNKNWQNCLIHTSKWGLPQKNCWCAWGIGLYNETQAGISI